MLLILIPAFIFIIWSIAIILAYYSTTFSSINHIEYAIGFGPYLIAIGIIYSIYKGWSLLSNKKEFHLTFLTGAGIILSNILLLSFIYTGFSKVKQSPFLEGQANGFTLFFHIIKLLIYPTVLVLLTRDVGITLAKLVVPTWKNIDIRLRVPAEITFGFFIFSILLLIIGGAGYYNFSGLIVALIVLFGIGFPGHKETYFDIKDRFVIVPNHILNGKIEDQINLKLLSIEFGFFFFSFLLGVSLISIIRPMPIGWDDLGVYMNFPKIMATTSELMNGGGMYVWQLITGTGFLFFYTAAQAFYVNQLGGILAVIFITSILSYALEFNGRKSLISLPVLLAITYYAMPMTVFQQAKDMKLDPAYLSFSLASLGILFYAWKAESKEYKYKLMWVIGILVGFTFSVKFTSLMVIIGVIGWLSYFYMSFLGYIGFFFIFLGIFTKFNLWAMMNVPIMKDEHSLTLVSVSLIVIGVVFLAIGWKDYGMNKLSEWLKNLIIFGIGVIIACTPWLAKNIYEFAIYGSGKLTIPSLLGGSIENNRYDYSPIFTKEEIIEKQKKQSEGMTKSGKSENEDLGRYFGYEEGLNNYLKLPFNLTFQKNQGGEFTDITYIFLALVPSLVLFVRGRRNYSMLLGGGMLLLFTILYYFTRGSVNQALNSFFGQFTLMVEIDDWRTYGYGVLIAINLLIVSIFHFCTEENEENKRLRDIVIFMGIYAFLFVISAFGIVWYGIVIYFGFFLIIGLSVTSFTHYSDTDSQDREKMSLRVTLTSILFIFIATYFVRSAFPHGWNNLRSAFYNEYKFNTLSQEESIFVYRSDYLVPIATLNLKDVTSAYNGIEEKMQSKEMKEFFSNTKAKDIPLDSMHAFITKYRTTRDPAFKNDIRTLGQNLYSAVLYPTKETENVKGIYRIGTFMTYLINKNNSRYFDDSLVMAFRDYFYDPIPEVTIERMKKMDLGYLLIDLNAATIDRDPRHDLTDRFEKLLLTTNAKNLRLVATDNYCLELAIGERKKGRIKTDEAFIDIAGTNYESYRGAKEISRGQKLAQCQIYILNMINEGRAEEYPLTAKIAEEIMSNQAAQNQEKLREILSRYVGQSWFALFEILDTPTPEKIENQTVSTGAALTGSAR